MTLRCASGEGTSFFLYRSAGAGTSKASYAFWQVEDVEAAVAELKGRGVGNILAVSQRI